MNQIGEPLQDAVLCLNNFGVAFSERTILASVDLEVLPQQVVCIVGPSGTGKSTLLRTLAGFNDASPNLRTWGVAEYCGELLDQKRRPKLVLQSTRLMMASVLENLVYDLPERSSLNIMQQRDLASRMLSEANLEHLVDELDNPIISLTLWEQRLVAIIRLCASGTRLLMLDEPTSGLPQGDERKILEYIRLQGTRRSILVTLHNQQQAKEIGSKVALLAGGVVCEEQEISGFFSNPHTEAAKAFVRTGSCSVPSPGSQTEDLSEESLPSVDLPEEAQRYVSDSFGPRGFLWLIKGKLAGTPMPGIFHEADYDLAALKRVGITHLVSLMAETEPPLQLYSEYDITGLWYPVEDMGAPDCEMAHEICQKIDEILCSGGSLAVHCRAGMGRTGTVLATYLIWKNESALGALDTVRNVEPRWVQSQDQVEFLERFYLYVEQIDRSDCCS